VRQPSYEEQWYQICYSVFLCIKYLPLSYTGSRNNWRGGFQAAAAPKYEENISEELETHNEMINNELCLLLRLRNHDKKFIKQRLFLLFFFQMLAVVSILHLEFYWSSAAAFSGE